MLSRVTIALLSNAFIEGFGAINHFVGPDAIPKLMFGK